MTFRTMSIGALILVAGSITTGCSNSANTTPSKSQTVAALTGANPPPSVLAAMAQRQASEMQAARANYQANASNASTIGQAAQAAKKTASQTPPASQN